MKVQSYKELDVWKKGVEIANLIFTITDLFPKEQKFVLGAQMQRAAISMPSNIAEGFARQYNKEFVQFCRIALGSCSELETQLIIAGNRNYCDRAFFDKAEKLLDVESRMLMNLIKSLKQR